MMTYWPAMTHRYILQIQAGRTDVKVISAGEEEMATLTGHFYQAGVNLFVLSAYVRSLPEAQMIRGQTAPPILDAGLVQITGPPHSTGP